MRLYFLKQYHKVEHSDVTKKYTHLNLMMSSLTISKMRSLQITW